MIPSVKGSLAGDPSAAPDYVWLEDGGARAYLLWPAGFHVQFKPTLQVLDENDQVVASQGDLISLPQVGEVPGGGTQDAPYLVHGQLGSRCYTPAG